MLSVFQSDGEWLRGCLHVHTTNSDGRKTPQEVVDFYRDHGFHFVALTDHGKVTPPDSVDSRGLTIITGAEVGAGKSAVQSTYHWVLVGMTGDLEMPEDRDSTEAIEKLAEQCRLFILAHPYWSGLTGEDMLAVAYYHAVELFNTGCELETQRGDSSVHWQQVLEAGRKVWAVAVDDAHWAIDDGAGGYTMVHTDDSSEEGIIRAILAGHCYASSGVEVVELDGDDEGLYLRTNIPCTLRLIAPRPGAGWTTMRDQPAPATEFRFTPPEGEFRIELVAPGGEKAWLQPSTWPPQ